MKKIIVLMFAAMFTVVAFAQQPEPARPAQKERVIRERVKPEDRERIPGLSADQKEKIKAIRMKVKKETLSLKNELAEKKARLRTLTTAEKAEMPEINKVIDEMASLKAKVMKAHEAARQEVRKLLNEEQRLMFDTKKERRGKRAEN